MDNNQNEMLSDDMVKSQNYFKYAKLSQYNAKDQNFKTSKTFNRLPPLTKTNSASDIRHGYNYTLRATKLEFNKLLENQQPKYDPNILKKELSYYRTYLQKRKTELLLLKIKYNKLLEENMNNKTLIANSLSIPLHSYISKEVLVYKIENCELTEIYKKLLEKAYKIINLKLEISDQKRRIAENNEYIEELQKNSKTKLISEYQNDFYTKCEQQRSLLNTLQKLEEKCNYYEKKIDEINEAINNDKVKGDKLLNKEIELNENYQNNVNNKNNLIKQISQLEEKIKKQEKVYSDKEKDIKEIERRMNRKEEQLNVINDYIYSRDEEIKFVEGKKKNKEDLEKITKEQEKQIQELTSEFDKLNEKMTTYRNEKPKLISKAKEPKKDIERMELLKTELQNLYKEKEKTETTHKEKQKELKEISEDENKKNEKNIKCIEKNNAIKDELNKKIDELMLKVAAIDKKNKAVETNINKYQKQLDELVEKENNIKKQNEQNNLEYEENQKNLDEERKKEQNKKNKEYKRELDRLKKEQNKLNNENNNMKQENTNYQNELEGYNQNLDEYDEIEKQLKQARIKLDSLMGT